MRGVPRSGLWSEEWESPRSAVRYASGTGSERAKGRERSGEESPASQGPSSAGGEAIGRAYRKRCGA